MTPYQEIKSAILKLKVREKMLKIELHEIEQIKLKLAYILGGGDIENVDSNKQKEK